MQVNSSGNGCVIMFGPTSIVSAIKVSCNHSNSYTQTMGRTMKLVMKGECRFIEASVVEEVLWHGFEPLSDKQGHSHRFSRQVSK